MTNKNYEILGLTEYATDEEIEARYAELTKKYNDELFLDGEAGNNAAKMLTEIRRAYKEIMEYRSEHAGSDGGLYKEVDEAIRSGDYKLAQQKLDSFDNRTAEWHYLQSVVYYKKNWANESKKQLEIAMNMDPSNEKYKNEYENLNSYMKSQSPNDWDRSGNTSSASYGNNGYYGYSDEQRPQMGGGGCLDFCCQMVACNMLLNCCCNGCR